jgi:hypothetical protein
MGLEALSDQKGQERSSHSASAFLPFFILKPASECVVK